MEQRERPVPVQQIINAHRDFAERMEQEGFAGAVSVVIWTDGSFSYNGHATSPAGRLAVIAALRAQAEHLERELLADMGRIAQAKIVAQVEAAAAAARGEKPN